MIGESARKTVGVPDYYTDEYNSTPMKNFWGILELLIDAFEPDAICEIGSERGLTSLQIALSHPDTGVHVVDPFVHETVAERANVVVHRETSVQFLEKKVQGIGFYLVDGDHNYETVSAEIKGIVGNWDGVSPICAVFHDVGWPFARRDGYYDPSKVKAPLPHEFDTALVLEHDGFARHGWENGRTFGLSVRHDEPETGVLTAIEDFIASSGQDGWHYSSMPLFYGLGILWNERSVDSEQAAKVRAVLSAIEMLRPVLAIAEINRLRLVQGFNETSAHLDEVSKELDRYRILRSIDSVFRGNSLKSAISSIKRRLFRAGA